MLELLEQWDLECYVVQNRETSLNKRNPHMGVALNGDTPISHPKMIIFSRKTYI